ncbi:MAG: hypothetical protein A2073_01945 [Deltaproteobacteria bacterium GWC2_42_11]|nr:MAG: hypothetical protein A2073_01945 [Deltaproteobacteria bacterium GWC2_42_11]HBO84892.1 DUF507 domain-containing protein [Deltaproteobacteria bacterium]
MRLSKEQVEKISRLMLENLKKKELIIFKANEDTVLHRIIDLFIRDLKTEDDLDREVENIMKQYSNEIEGGRMDYRKMFSMIKHKLVKERGIVI